MQEITKYRKNRISDSKSKILFSTMKIYNDLEGYLTFHLTKLSQWTVSHTCSICFRADCSKASNDLLLTLPPASLVLSYHFCMELFLKNRKEQCLYLFIFCDYHSLTLLRAMKSEPVYRFSFFFFSKFKFWIMHTSAMEISVYL